ncbi:guanitoxin biosynthesis L-enduracididine beta-hydroxylase GntD [Streptomyces aculeolatus]
MTSEPGTLTLTTAEQTELAALAAEAVDRFGSPAAPVLRRLTVLADVLPRRVREFLAEFRHDDPRGGVVVRGLPVDAPRLPPTPGHWRDRKDGGSAHADFLLALLACRLGDLFAWRTLQEGRLLTDVLPVAGEEDVQTGHGSEAPLEFHCEDAFHELRCDYLGLLCLRNPRRVATTFAAFDPALLSAEDLRTLAEPVFHIRPDSEHRKWMDEETAAEPVPVLFGHPHSPYLRLDPPFMRPRDGDRRAAAALGRLLEQLAARLCDVVLAPGDVLFVDNYRAVHGRRPFRPRYDGTDRWLRRALVTRDLRRSSAVRADPLSHTI